MTVYVKKSTDVGAPTLTNTAGSLITLLDYLLVTTMGWTKPYTGTNLAAYRAPSGTNQFYLRVDDTNANFGRIVGYESMSDVNTGTGAFPTAAQVSGGLYLDKSSSGTRPWKFYSNGKIFYLFIQYNGTNWFVTMFGDLESYKSGDAYGTVIVAQNVAATAGQNGAQLTSSVAGSASSGHYCARAYTQVGTSLAFAKFTDYVRSANGGTIGNSGMTYPSPIEGGLHLAPLWMAEGAAGVRGLFPGFWCPLHNRPLTDGDTFSGVSGTISGRSFEAVDFSNGVNQCFIETSNTWGGV